MNQVTKCGSCGGVSSLSVQAGGTNANCHGFTGGVAANGAVLIPKAQIVLVLWDHFYITNPDAVTAAKQLITDLIGGPFINGLTQYGIHRGSLIKTIIVDTNSVPAPKLWDISDVNDSSQVLTWINNGTLSPKPQSSPQGLPPNLLYFIFMPSATQLTNGKNSDSTPNTNVCGWHHSGNLADANGTPVFWALVRTDQAPQTNGLAFVSSFAFCVSHELAEAVTNPDTTGNFGFISSNSCEIGDICEQHTFTYRGWSVEQYWSNWDATCINGDQPVSVRKFLSLTGYNGAAGLRGLPGLSQPPYNYKLDLDYIADRMFPQVSVSGG